MTEPRPFSIRMFFPDGTADGVRELKKTNWSGVGIVCPRALLPEAKTREEFSRPGVYVLVGPAEEGDLPMIYVGQGAPVRPRVESHAKQKDFWTWVVFFTAADASLTTAHVKHLESRLVGLAHEAKRAHLDNGNVPKPLALSPADHADAEAFLADMLSVLPVVGLHAFERTKRSARPHAVLELAGRGVTARGEDTAAGFVVFEGSQAALSEVPSIHGFLSNARRDLLQQGVLVPADGYYVFAQDYTFTSPSSAAGVALGRSSNGRTEWKDGQGRTLKQLQS